MSFKYDIGVGFRRGLSFHCHKLNRLGKASTGRETENTSPPGRPRLRIEQNRSCRHSNRRQMHPKWVGQPPCSVSRPAFQPFPVCVLSAPLTGFSDGGDVRDNIPVLGGLELEARALSFDHHRQSHALHTPGAQPRGDEAPDDGGQGEAARGDGGKDMEMEEG